MLSTEGQFWLGSPWNFHPGAPCDCRLHTLLPRALLQMCVDCCQSFPISDPPLQVCPEVEEAAQASMDIAAVMSNHESCSAGASMASSPACTNLLAASAAAAVRLNDPSAICGMWLLVSAQLPPTSYMLSRFYLLAHPLVGCTCSKSASNH